MVGLAAAAGRFPAPLLSFGLLLRADVGKDGPKALVFHDIGLGNLANLVKYPVGQVDAAVADREPPVRVVPP